MAKTSRYWKNGICSAAIATAALLVLPQNAIAGGQDPTVPQSGSADDESSSVLDEVIVTAERRTSTAQKTAASITVQQGSEMQQQGRASLASILENVPGVNGGAKETSGTSDAAGTDNPAGGIVIRGIPSNTGAGGSATSIASAAAIYVDGVYNGTGGGYDIDRVEVLRGPQGTLYGRSATSGVVAIHTRNPDLNDVNAEISGEAGDYGLYRLSGGVSIPLVEDRLAIRVSGAHYERDGYYASVGDRTDSDDFRIKVLAEPTDNFSALLGFAYQHTTSGTGGVESATGGVSIVQDPTTPGEYEYQDVEAGGGTNKFLQVWGEFTWDLGGVVATYIPAFRTWEQESWSPARTAFLSFDQTIATPVDDFTTHEFRLSSDNDSVFQWQTGFLTYSNTLEDTNKLVLYPSGALGFESFTQKKTTAYGVFGEATLEVSPETRLTMGLRYDHTDVQVEQQYTSINLVTETLSGEEGHREYDNLTYKVRLEHDLTPANMIYALASTGVSPGDVSLTTDVSGDPELVEMEAQILEAYEIGSKNRFMDNRVQANAAVFYYDYGGFQTAGLDIGMNTFRTVITPIKVLGGELEVLARLWEGGQLGFNIAYTRSRYHDIPQFAELFGSDVVPNIPPVEASIFVHHHFELGGGSAIGVHADARYASDYEAGTPTDAEVEGGAMEYAREDASVIFNLSATLLLQDDRHSVTAYVRNLTDERLKTSVNVGSATPGYVESSVGLSAPRTFGLVWTARF